jgi:hypothetical protein
VSGPEVQEAFRRGVRGIPLVPGDGLAEEAAAYAAGANEGLLLALSRLAGLTEPNAAYETGRALRRIAQLFDQAGAPARIGAQFLDNIAGAVVIERMRGRPRPWGAADTVDMFVELYARILGGRPEELDAIRRSVMDYAVGDRVPVRSAAPEPWYRRRA